MEEGESVNFSAEGTNIKEDLEDITTHIKEEPLDSLVEDIYSRAAVFYPEVAMPAVHGAPSKGLTEDYSLCTEAQLGEVYRSRGLSLTLGGRGVNIDQAKKQFVALIMPA